MADLPEDRMESTPPFTYCQMDCFGPFIVKERIKELKRYAISHAFNPLIFYPKSFVFFTRTLTQVFLVLVILRTSPR